MNHRDEKAATEVTVGGATPLHVAQKCVEAAEKKMRLTLTLPAVPGTGSTRRLYKDRDGPRGDVVGRQDHGGRTFEVVAFDPMEVLAWLHHKGLVNVVEKGSTPVSSG